ncbi:MAG: decarboxylating 6-phosphogluconate dehydrogenase [Dehalococcoidia bacterium]
MQLGMIGLGRMGGAMAERLLGGGHEVVGYDLDPAAVATLARKGGAGASSILELVGNLTPPRVVWSMLPAGEATEQAITTAVQSLSRGDTIIDGGNANYKDSMRRAAALREKGIVFLDVGVSGGIWGFKQGYCLMVGGDRETSDRLEPIFQTLAPAADQGYAYMGPSGAGHFVKMVHNGVEYGLMQAYAEGFQLLQAKDEFALDLAAISHTWRYGSVVSSWLLDRTAEALAEDPRMSALEPYVDDTGEGRWTVQESLDLAMPAPVITLALQERFRSRQESSFADRLLAAMRQRFGGHAVRKAER